MTGLLAAGILLMLAGGIARLLLERRPVTGDRLYRFGVIGGCVVALVPALAVLTGFGGRSALFAALSGGPDAPFGVDVLSAWFLLPVLGVGAAAAAFGVSSMTRERPHRRVGTVHLGCAVLVAALAGVVTARTVLAFLVCWEIMALSAYFLVIFESEQPGVRRAGLIYLVLTHLGSLALVSMFAIWAGGNIGWTFADLASAAAGSGVPAGLILSLALVGFGIKAGVFPGHFWLPGAHASAPSHVSAVLSGVMLKAGIYGLFRVLALLGPPPAWWGWTVLLLGLVSSVLGVLWALAQHDLKRLLAYHSVENIGIILLGLGLGALGSTYHEPVLSILGYTGALLHTLNHALFKSLLFLGAGAVVHATGTREIDRLGGLARRMPGTAAAFLIGSAAIVGLPPLNGFVSEWLIFMGLIQGGISGGGVRAACVMTVGLALTGALARACFTKLYGTIFLGQPRDPDVVPHGGAEKGLVPPQAVLAALCVAIGVLPLPVVSAAARAAAVLSGGASGRLPEEGLVGAALAISLVSVAVLVLSALIALARRATSPRGQDAASATWGCAYGRPTARMQYTASSFAAPLLAAFGPLSGSRAERSASSFRTHATDLVFDFMGQNLWRRLRGAAARVRRLQSGGIRRYLAYVILTVLGLLLYLRSGGPR